MIGRSRREATARSRSSSTGPSVPMSRDGTCGRGRRRSESLVENLALVQAGECVGAGHLGFVGEGERADHLSAHPHAAAVDEDPVEPGVDPLGIAQLSPVEPGLDRGIVDGILGIRSVAEK